MIVVFNRLAVVPYASSLADGFTKRVVVSMLIRARLTEDPAQTLDEGRDGDRWITTGQECDS